MHRPPELRGRRLVGRHAAVEIPLSLRLDPLVSAREVPHERAAPRALGLGERDSVLRANGDKAISVGERTHLFATNSLLADSAIGLQAKDGSQAVLYNVDLRGNDQALDAYRKNWRYGTGGKIRVYKAQIAGNSRTFAADKKSRIWVYDSYVEGSIHGLKRVTIDPTVDQQHKVQARIDTLWQHPDERDAPVMFADYWTSVDPGRRGATKVGTVRKGRAGAELENETLPSSSRVLQDGASQ